MKADNSNISALFNSLNSNNSMGFNFADYAAIKNGSYGKLVKAYYAEDKADSTSTAKAVKASTSNTAKTSKADVDTTGLNQMKKEADKLKLSAEALNSDELWEKKDGKADMTKIAGAVKDFAANYNNVIDQASKVSSKEVAQDVKFMTGMTDTFSKVLGKIGVTVGADGKMAVDEEAVKNADFATVKSLFSGNATYGSQIADKAANIKSDADLGTSLYGSDASVSSAISSVYNQFI